MSINDKCDDLELMFINVTGDGFSDEDYASVRGFFMQLPELEVYEAMLIALKKIKQPKEVIRYFYGICWTKIRAEK